ncbi:MAG: hypothetical protein IT375_05195, partial [Polyangiaceae bacterium]|nr:hypothetical protein [Polyangiaceae bacterium]
MTMRWFIEVSRLGEETPLEKYCLEAKQWQAALQEARKRRGDTGPLSKFSIELLEQGYRAVDPGQKIRYVVNKAPPDASLSQPPPAGPVAAPGSFPSPQVPAEPVIKSAHEPAASTDPMASPLPHSDPLASAPKTDPMAALPPESHPPRTDPLPHPPPAPAVTIPPDDVPPIGAGSPSSTTQPMTAPAAPPRPASTQLTQRSLEVAREPDFQVVKKREEEPTEKMPMLYREYAYAVRPGTERASTEVLLWLRFRELRDALQGRTERKFIQLAVFDHVFEKKPARPPIATLMWKDWRGDPALQFPDPSGPVGTLSPPAVTAPPPAVTLPPSTTQPAAALTEPASPPTEISLPNPAATAVVSQPFAPAPSSPIASEKPLDPPPAPPAPSAPTASSPSSPATVPSAPPPPEP